MTGATLELPPGAQLTPWFDEHGLNSRTACRRAQLELARENDRIFSLEGDLALPQVPFDRELPERFLQLGIAEANLVGVAAGLSMRGIVPFVNTFASFATMRACEQVRLDVAYHASNVKIVGYYAGLSGGWTGPSHHCNEDIAIMRVLPNMTVLSPSDAYETYQATIAAAQHDGPVYLRTGRADTPRVHEHARPFQIGRAICLRDGGDVTIAATGCGLVAEAVVAAELLARLDGIAARVLAVHTIKPLDEEAIIAAASATGCIVTLEDHSVIGGLGSAVASVVAEHHPVPVARLGIRDQFCVRCDEHEAMLALHGLTAQGARSEVLRRLRDRG